MSTSYTYRTTPRIQSLITQIETYKVLFEKLPKQPQIQENLLRRSLIKSSLFSARIEGNTLELYDIERNHGEPDQKKEVFQLLDALKLARTHLEMASLGFIYKIHETVMDGLTSELGRFRSKQSAIFNSAGIAVYLPPPPQNVKNLMSDFIKGLNESVLLEDIAVLHFIFEKIHPFLDGNGRVGRVLINWQLMKMGYGFGGLTSFEEYLENNRDRYYENLMIQGKDITEFVEFILEAISLSAEKLILELQEKKEGKVEDSLLPRRAEILQIIREHKMISFDQIRRRFLMVSTRTLHFDLEHLIKIELVKKLGSTRGAVYTAK